MKKLYRAKIKSQYVEDMATCALDKIHAFKLVQARLIAYGLTEKEFKIERLWQDGTANDWDLETTLIYR